jgi:hypothetical protein
LTEDLFKEITRQRFTLPPSLLKRANLISQRFALPASPIGEAFGQSYEKGKGAAVIRSALI